MRKRKLFRLIEILLIIKNKCYQKKKTKYKLKYELVDRMLQ